MEDKALRAVRDSAVRVVLEDAAADRAALVEQAVQAVANPVRRVAPAVREAGEADAVVRVVVRVVGRVAVRVAVRVDEVKLAASE